MADGYLSDEELKRREEILAEARVNSERREASAAERKAHAAEREAEASEREATARGTNVQRAANSPQSRSWQEIEEEHRMEEARERQIRELSEVASDQESVGTSLKYGAQRLASSVKEKVKQAPASTVALGAAGFAGLGAALKGMVSNDSNSDQDETFLPLLLSVLLFLSDIFMTRFNGISWNPIQWMIMSNPMDIVWFFANGVIGTILLVYWAIRRPSGREMGAFILLTLVIYSIAMWSGFTIGAMLHLFFAIYIYFVIIKNSTDIATGHYTLAFFMIVDFFLLSALTDLTDFPFWFIPVWFLGVLFLSSGKRKGPLSGLLIFVVIGFFMFGFASEVGGFQDFANYLDPDVQAEFLMFSLNSWDAVKNSANNLWNSAKSIQNQTLAVYREDYYTGVVDTNARKKLGVYLEDLELAQPTFFADEPVSLWGTLVASTLGDGEQITVMTSCMANKKDDQRIRVADLVKPGVFIAEDYDEQPLDCMFNRNAFFKGTQLIEISAQFDFKTMAYQKVYFIDNERALALKRQEIDPLEHYGITESDPKTIYTNGPVMIGMDFRGSPVRLSSDEDADLMLGVTFKNQWDGKVLRINSIDLTYPKGIEPVMAENSQQACSGYNFTCGAGDKGTVCSMINDSLPKEFNDYKTMRCPVVITSGNVRTVLGESPLSILYFRATASYDYLLEDKKSVVIKESEEMEKIREETKAKPPVLVIPDIYGGPGTSRIADLALWSSDSVTPDRYFYYQVEKIVDKSIIDCSIVKNHYLNCTLKKAGHTNVTVSINDLARDVDRKFQVFVGNDTCDWADTDCIDALNKAREDAKNPLSNATSGTSTSGSITLTNEAIYDQTYSLLPFGSSSVSFYFKVNFKGADTIELSQPSDYLDFSTVSSSGLERTDIKLAHQDVPCTLNYEVTVIAKASDGSSMSRVISFELLGSDSACGRDCISCDAICCDLNTECTMESGQCELA
ncbi:hypothetical protein H6504_02680 [Candidatus Woesearchaeota archaeon]|nr:hypothetical protein [Candidatus Woesearchaeota archaeon]